MRRHPSLAALLGAMLLLAGAVAPAPAMAQVQAPAQAQERPRQEQGRLVPLSRVIQMIAQRTPGHQLNTTSSESGGRPTYVIQWQRTDGRVVVIVVDAESGQIIG